MFVNEGLCDVIIWYPDNGGGAHLLAMRWGRILVILVAVGGQVIQFTIVRRATGNNCVLLLFICVGEGRSVAFLCV